MEVGENIKTFILQFVMWTLGGSIASNELNQHTRTHTHTLEEMIRGACKGLAATDKMLTIHMYIFVLCVSQIVFLRVYFWRREEKEKKNRLGKSGGGTGGCQLLTIHHLSWTEARVSDRRQRNDSSSMSSYPPEITQETIFNSSSSQHAYSPLSER